MTDYPKDVDRLIHEALTELGWNADASAVADRVRRLEIGIPREDEFSVVCSWLGKCDLIHKLDQLQVPLASREEYQVPDLLAVFRIDEKSLPVLIEVKSSKTNTLSLKPGYLNKLNNYSSLLNLPILLAWKFHGIWMLFETKHLKKAKTNFNISFGDALKENLLGVLAGDFSYSLGKGAGLHFRFRKDKLVKEEDKDDEITQEWLTVIDEVTFTDYEGRIRNDLEPQVQSLFTAWDLEEEQEHSATHIKMSFVAQGENALFAHMALVRLLDWELKDEDKIKWRNLLMKENVVKNIGNFSSAVNKALEQGIVHHILHQQPQTIPEFIQNSYPAGRVT